MSMHKSEDILDEMSADSVMCFEAISRVLVFALISSVTSRAEQGRAEG